MSKRIQLIEDMVYQLQPKDEGTAKRGHWNLVETLTDGLTTWSLIDWGTEVARLEATTTLNSAYTITDLYGESRSDADGVATFLNMFNIVEIGERAERYLPVHTLYGFNGHYKPSTGTFYMD